MGQIAAAKLDLFLIALDGPLDGLPLGFERSEDIRLCHAPKMPKPGLDRHNCLGAFAT
jgi:hypothetical protein